jgi:hypothetical protein
LKIIYVNCFASWNLETLFVCYRLFKRRKQGLKSSWAEFLHWKIGHLRKDWPASQRLRSLYWSRFYYPESLTHFNITLSYYLKFATFKIRTNFDRSILRLNCAIIVSEFSYIYISLFSYKAHCLRDQLGVFHVYANNITQNMNI